MINRYSSRLKKLDDNFLVQKLEGAVSYDRIAGYFCSSVFEISGEALTKISGKARIICNSGLLADEVKVAGMAKQKMQQEWCEFKPEEKAADEITCANLRSLYELLVSGKVEIRVMPDEIYGMLHGKAGVITYSGGKRTCFIGSANETRAGYQNNYELLWEDESKEGVDWLQKEFDFFWNDSHAVSLSDFVIEDIQRVSNRKIVPLIDWRSGNDENKNPAAVIEDPVFRRECGLWDHQKYFVTRAFREHQEAGGARLVLADMVGLGKTIQLAMAAKLMGLQGNLPILIVVPKTIIWQWQDELSTLLDLPSAVWTGDGWRDENGIDHPAVDDSWIMRCPRRVGIVSQGIITHGTESAKALLNGSYECVIVDEAHRARRKNLGKDPNEKAQPNNMLKFIQNISPKAKSILLATATPIQIHPIEAYDLLEAINRDRYRTYDKVLGDKFSIWRNTPVYGLDLISGKEQYPDNEADIWQLERNPFPPDSEETHNVRFIRNRCKIADNVFVLSQESYKKYDRVAQKRIQSLFYENDFVANLNPYVRTIIRRTRDALEKDGLLKKIEVVLYGEDNSEALELKGYLKQAYSLAEDFCQKLAHTRKGGGFMTTMMLRRIGSTMLAGENTAKKILAWTPDGKKALEDLYADAYEDDDFDEGDEENTGATADKFKQLSEDEIAVLTQLLEVLQYNKDTDPKYLKVVDILKKGVKKEGPWINRGCMIFSQYFDSADYVARNLSEDFPDTEIGLYAGGTQSRIYLNGSDRRVTKEDIKQKVRDRELKVLVGTDAASEGLNLQMLGALINLDLPWNPTRLEQRKGRIQRIGQEADTVYLYNLRYKDSVEDKVHDKLSARLQDIFNIFGQIPDMLEDVWVSVARGEEEKAEDMIKKLPAANPYKNKYDSHVERTGEAWEKCSAVLDKQEVREVFLAGWK